MSLLCGWARLMRDSEVFTSHSWVYLVSSKVQVPPKIFSLVRMFIITPGGSFPLSNRIDQLTNRLKNY